MVKDQVQIIARPAQISKEKQQSVITLRHEGQSIRNISRTLKVSSSAVAKCINCYDETCSHEDRHRNDYPELPLLRRISSLQLTAPQIATQINTSQSSSNRENVFWGIRFICMAKTDFAINFNSSDHSS